MKKFFEYISDKDLFFLIVISLLLGLFTGVFFKSSYSIGIRTFYNKLYQKVHPDINKDSKTLIRERATKDAYIPPQKSIFEEPQKKENGLIIFIKKILPHKEKPQTIHDMNY